LSTFIIKVLWLENNVALAVDQVVNTQAHPLTRYFFWPRSDAWEQLKNTLGPKLWISETEKAEILNKASEIIAYWHTHGKNSSLTDVQVKFPGLIFAGNS
jgi:30S ribosomal protein 3